MPIITPFQNKVYNLTKQIPKGKVSTYKAIAEALNNPKACQAVGMALSKNPYAPIVPCHRVVASNGDIGGFNGTKDKSSNNIKKKIALLKAEKIYFENNKIKNLDKYLFNEYS